MNIQVLMENKSNKNVLFEHGLSILIDDDVLFDTGQTNKIIDNAKTLNISLEKVKYLVLSHGHYDHCGGVLDLINKYKVNVLANEFLFLKKYKKTDEKYIYNGINFDESDITFLNKIKDDVYKIKENLYMVSNFKRSNRFEELSSNFYVLKNNKYKKDYFLDESCLVYESIYGLIVIVACSHRGIINILSSIKERFKKDIYMVIGGFHLTSSSEFRINKTINQFRKLNVKKVIANHCTGDLACKLFKKEYKDDFINLHSGDSYNIGSDCFE